MPDAPDPTERISEWSSVREGLARIEDATRALQVVALAVAGADPPRFRPALRPVTAVDAARAANARLKHERLVARLVVVPD